MGCKRRYCDQTRLWFYALTQDERWKGHRSGADSRNGWSFLDELLTKHPDADFVQLQLNYADWEAPVVAARENYKIARKHGKPIIVMEPVKGGALANPPLQVEKILKSADARASCASWAVRFAASLEGVQTVLSGMSNVEQMMDNLSYRGPLSKIDKQRQNVYRSI